jgi:hypothetical protein
MMARFGRGATGEERAWRCYAEFKQNNNDAACITNDGELTTEGCSDPEETRGFCEGEALTQIIDMILSNGCVDTTTDAQTTVVPDTTIIIETSSTVTTSSTGNIIN